MSYPLATVESIKADEKSAIAIGPFGSRMKADLYTENGIPVIRGLNLGNGRELIGPYVYVSEETANGLQSSNLKPGDLVFPHRGNIGEVGIIPASLTRSMMSTSLMKLRVDCAKVLPDYLFHFFRSEEGRRQLLLNASQVGTPGISTPLASLKQLVFPLPNLAIQRDIVEVLGSLNDKIELNRTMNATLEEMVQTLYKSWFVDFAPVKVKARRGDPVTELSISPEAAELFPNALTELEDGTKIPIGWNRSTIGEVASVVGGSTPSTARPDFWDGDLNWVTPRDLSRIHTPILLHTERRITEAGLTQISSGLLPVGSVLLSSRAPIGYLVINAIPVAINQGFIAMKPNGEIPSTFLYCWVKENMDAILARANGSTFLEVSKSNFRPLPVILPENRLLQVFGQMAASLFSQIALNSKESLDLTRMLDELLPRLMNGEVQIVAE
jgi:type I restriction enzyme S subunit